MKKYYVATYKGNWADEMDINYFSLLREDEVKILKQLQKGKGKVVEILVGSNQDMEVELDDVKIEEISEEDYKVLDKYSVFNYGVSTIIQAAEEMFDL